MNSVFVLFKIKHNGSQGWAILYFYLIVIFVARFARLDDFQCYKRKNGRKMEEKKKEKQNYQTWIDLSQSIDLRKPKYFVSDPALYYPTGWGLAAHLSSLSYHPAERSSLQSI